MMIRGFVRNTDGTTAVEFAMTAPLFIALLLAVVESSLMLWTQLGMQHGTENAARCASVNQTTCGTLGDIQNYAAQQAFGLKLSPSIFSVSTPACGNQVVASYDFGFISAYMMGKPVTLTARACYPKPA
jgi:Flp pilus assembly protein TadG